MEMQDLSVVRGTDVGELGVLHLKRLWARALSGNRAGDGEGHVDQFVLDGLEVDVIEAMGFLHRCKPDFPGFEAWILGQRSGPIPDATREKINRAVRHHLEGRRRDYPLGAEIEDRVFGVADRACWRENGYVVLRGAVPREDCAALEAAVWQHLGLRPQDPPEAWRRRDGIFWVRGFRHPLLDKNRSSQRIRKAYEEIWGTDELFLSVDQVSFNPPLGGNCTQFGPSNLHWDASIAQPMPFDVIGVLYLNDVEENQGAFQCVPGFHHRMPAWLAELPEGSDPRRAILDAFPSVRIGGKAGDLIVWRQELPHGSSVNRGRYPRFAQHLTMYPGDRAINPVWL